MKIEVRRETFYRKIRMESWYTSFTHYPVSLSPKEIRPSAEMKTSPCSHETRHEGLGTWRIRGDGVQREPRTLGCLQGDR